MRTLIAALTLGLGLAATVQADGIYKWEDENGVVHFGSQPPQTEQVEVVKAPKSARLKQWQQEQDALIAQRKVATTDEAEANTASAEPAPEADDSQQEENQQKVSQAETAARAQRCRSAQRQLQELESHARVREVDADGNYRVLPEEERQQRIQQARQILQTNC